MVGTQELALQCHQRQLVFMQTADTLTTILKGTVMPMHPLQVSLPTPTLPLTSLPPPPPATTNLTHYSCSCPGDIIPHHRTGTSRTSRGTSRGHGHASSSASGNGRKRIDMMSDALLKESCDDPTILVGTTTIDHTRVRLLARCYFNVALFHSCTNSFITY